MSLNYDAMPVLYMREAVIRYVEDGIPPDSFLCALLSNDLMEACKRADCTNQRHIYEWASFLYCELPFSCYGSPAKIEAWIAHKGLSGLNALARSQSHE